jgi:hypothetical protein
MYEIMIVEVSDETDGYEVWCAKVLSFVILFLIINHFLYLPFVIGR